MLVYAMGYTLSDLDEKENAPAPSGDDTEALSVDEVVGAFVRAGLVPEGRDLSDQDLRFLEAIVAALREWFAE